MGTEVFLALLCSLALTEATSKVFSIASPIRILGNVNAGSVSRLYRNVPLGVYASAAPYGAYSFNVPTFVSPNINKQNFIPLKEESVQNIQGFLRDSYGQKYQETPQTIAYRTTFPQQYVPLQNLPAHLSQPLVAASPNFQFRQVTPHFFGSAQISGPTVQSFPPTLLNRFVQSSQPAVSQTYAPNTRTVASQQSLPLTHSQIVFSPTSQASSSENKDVHVDKEKFKTLKIEPQHQHVKAHTIHAPPEIIEQNAKQSQQSIKKQKLQQPGDPIVTTHVNGETVVTIPTKPNLPLLDLSLLEPLHFDNPLVPQVQHFLPRINQATYHTLPTLHGVKKNTKPKPKKQPPKKKQKKPRPQQEHKDEDDDNPITSVTVVGTPELNASPEFSYEINSPNYKETYTEKKVKYNKETQSEPVHYNYEKKTKEKPVHYSYDKHTQSEPVHYSYTTSSNDPGPFQQIVYNNKEEPKQLVFHFKPENKGHNYEERVLSSPQTESEEQHSLQESPNAEKVQEKEHSQNNREEIQESHTNEPKENEDYHPEHIETIPIQEHKDNPEHRSHNKNTPRQHIEQEYPDHRGHNKNTPRQHIEQEYPEHQSHNKNPPRQHNEQEYPEQYVKSIEYEEDISPPFQTPASHNENLEEEHRPHSKHNSEEPKQQYQSFYNPHHTQFGQQPVVHEKSKRIIIKEEAPAVSPPNAGEIMAAMIKEQEENEEDFEKAYKNAAYGFPAFNSPSIDAEKEIYNPESYGATKYHSDFDIENTPLQQYQVQGDDYPTNSRANYKDEKDKMQEEYYLDYAISRPESILERYKNKDDYYKIFAKQKPEKYFGAEEEKKKSAKYTFAYPQPQKEQQAKQKSAPYVYEYKFAKETPRDNSAFASRPVNHRYKSKTQFVEPQYQYGFEPISIPQLLDSELAAMASNDNIESENPGMRKKVYKENWYIKKTTTGKAR